MTKFPPGQHSIDPLGSVLENSSSCTQQPRLWRNGLMKIKWRVWLLGKITEHILSSLTQIPLNKASVLGTAPVEKLSVHRGRSSSQVCSLLLLSEEIQDVFHQIHCRLIWLFSIFHTVKKSKKQGCSLCAWSKTKICHICVKGKRGMFQFIPNEMFQRDCYGFSGTSPACHKTLRHKDARHSHANRIFTLPDKMRLFFAIEIIPGKRSCCVSAPLKRTSVHPRKKKKNHNIIRVNCLLSPTGLSGLGRGFAHYSHGSFSPLHMSLCAEKWIVCWAVV